jgi:hypothetical protein
MADINVPSPAPSGPDTVRVAGDTIHITAAQITDACAARLIVAAHERGTPPIRTLERVVETGARLMDQAVTHAQLDYVREALQGAATEVTTRIADAAAGVSEELARELCRVFDPTRGELAQVLGRHSEGVQQAIAQSFDENSASAVQHGIKLAVDEALERSQRRLLAHLSSTDGSNPLADFKAAIGRIVEEAGRRQERAAAEMREGLTQVRTDLAALTGERRAEKAAEEQLAAERARGTAAGFRHEDRVHAILARIATAHGDVAHDVSDQPSPAGRKTGDSVIEIDAASGPAQGRIVVEAKSERLSWARAASELDRALEERDADYAILVVSGEDRLPSRCGSLEEYLGNKLVVALTGNSQLDEELLRLACRYARVRTRLLRGGSLRLDGLAVRQATEEALHALAGARSIAGALTGAARNIETARESFGALVESVTAQLERIETLVRPADDGRRAA